MFWLLLDYCLFILLIVLQFDVLCIFVSLFRFFFSFVVWAFGGMSKELLKRTVSTKLPPRFLLEFSWFQVLYLGLYLCCLCFIVDKELIYIEVFMESMMQLFSLEGSWKTHLSIFSSSSVTYISKYWAQHLSCDDIQVEEWERLSPTVASQFLST